jgi:outer membrane protein assembly factor BamB
VALIELDLDVPPDRLAGRRTPPPWRYRPLGMALVVILALTLAGATPRGGTFWRPLGLIPADAGTEATIQLAGGRVFTVVLAGESRTLSAWDPQPSPHRLWSAEVPISATFDPANGVFGVVRVQRIGDLLLVGAGLSSTVLDADTGAIRWTTANRITPVGDGLAVLTDRMFRAGTLYDQESGDPGMLYFSADGQPHVEPPVRTEVRGLDLATGTVLWTATPGGSVTAEAAGGDGPAAVLITASDRLSLRDGRTGEVLRETELAQEGGTGPGTSDVLDDVALIGYPEAGVQAGYDVRTLERLWTRDLHTDSRPDGCAGLLCASGDREVQVLDRRTGRTAWSAPSDSELAARGDGSVLLTRPDADGPGLLVDAATGAPRTDLTGWDGEVEGSGSHALLLWRDEKGGGRAFGAVLPGSAEARYLGAAEGLGGDCGGDDRYVVCRDVRGLRVWAYRI